MENEAGRTVEMTEKEWKGTVNPIRQLVLYGWDDSRNPALCILYGMQELVERENKDYLKNNVKYELYYSVSGKKGHFPSFPELEIIDWDKIKLYHARTKTHYNYYYGDKREDYLVKESHPFDPFIVLPYYDGQAYADIVQEIQNRGIVFNGFQMAENPNDVLKLDVAYQDQFPAVCQLFCNPNLYMRRKYMSQLLDQNLPKDFYEYLMKIGSVELIAGIFLEMAKRKNPILLENAEAWENAEDFTETNYMNGIRRCAGIYQNSMDEMKKAERKRDIEEHLPDMDLYYHGEAYEEWHKEKADGIQYRAYSYNGDLEPYRYEYEWVNHKSNWRKILQSKYYKESIYSDGRTLNIIAVKHTLQEAEIYGLYDVIGKIAYFIDAPRLYYYFQANGLNKARDYFRRYLKRLIDRYADTDPDIYMQIMKVLFTSYQEGDFTGQDDDTFEHNYFARQYLWRNLEYQGLFRWYWNSRAEFCPEIWDEHLKVVIEIAATSKVKDILNACYFILKENMENGKLEEQIDDVSVIAFMNSPYKPLAGLGQELLAKRLDGGEVIQESLILALFDSEDKKVRQIASSYLETHPVSVGLMVNLLLISANQDWYPAWNTKISGYSAEEMISFVGELFAKREAFREWKIEEVMDVLHIKTAEAKTYEWESQKSLFEIFYSALWLKEDMPWIHRELMQSMLFSFEREDLKKLLQGYSLQNLEKELYPENARILTALIMVQSSQIPSSSRIADLIEKGNAQMLRMMLEVVEENADVLLKRIDIFLMFAESPVLLLHEAAKRILHLVDSEKRKEMLILLIGSPVERAYTLAMEELDQEYQEAIPQEFLMKMLEHPSDQVKAYIAKKAEHVIEKMGSGDVDLFFYYVKTLLYLPNKISKSKQLIYEKLPHFSKNYPEQNARIEEILYDIGGSNCKKDSEQALVALAKMRNEVRESEGLL